MIREAIDRIVELTKTAADRPIEINGRTYWNNSGNAIIPPVVSAVAVVTSLDALLSAIDAPELAGLADDLLGSLQIVVVGPRRVVVTTAPGNTWAQRDRYIDAKCETDSFLFDRFMDIEEFIIKAQCLFVDSDTKRALVTHVSSISGEEVVTNTDDGVSQTVVVKDQLNRDKHAELSPMMTLRPYRTFPEVRQPSSPFLLRMKKRDGLPQVALFDADGGLWIAKACANIAAYLRSDERVKRTGIAVIG